MKINVALALAITITITTNSDFFLRVHLCRSTDLLVGLINNTVLL